MPKEGSDAVRTNHGRPRATLLAPSTTSTEPGGATGRPVFELRILVTATTIYRTAKRERRSNPLTRRFTVG
jgi:hypothetical protein